MKLLLSWLLFTSLCALSSWSSPVVIQSPDVSVTEGENITITCCWSVEAVRLAGNWMKNQILVKHFLQSSGTSQNCTELTFVNITHNDSGNYICKVTVELELYAEFEGNGTIIRVKDRINANTTGGSSCKNMPSPVIISLTVVVPVLLIVLAWVCVLWRRRVLATRVIYETPHSNSEVADVDKHSTSSSKGSTQWCRVPVYESFDYFEGLQNQRSG